MNWTDSIVRVIELNTFTNIWYWIVVIASWSWASNWVLGVPFDVLFRARKGDEGPMRDLEQLLDVHVRRLANYHRSLGPWLIGLLAFLISALAMAGFYYGIELAQGMLLLAAPLCLIGAINLRLALRLDAAPLSGKPLVKRLFLVRLWTQIVAMISLFFTAMYGIYYGLMQLQFF